MMKRLLTLIGICSVLALATTARAAEFRRVAYDDAGTTGKQPHVVDGADWRVAVGETFPDAARTVAFGLRVDLAYSGLNPKAQYRVKLRFLSDGPRQERIKAGNTVLVESLTLEKGQIVEREIDLPVGCYADGLLSLGVETVAGPNAIVSEVEILSTDPTPLGEPRLPEVALPVLTPRPAEKILDLGGTWKFSPTAPAGFEKQPAHGDWANIRVPSEWVMQGFTVQPNTPAAYFRTFSLSEKPAGRRIKLRFSSVNSLCRVWVNGSEIGGHDAGFVPFEFDVTDAVKAGENTLAVSVQSESPSDQLACATQYACHPLGGITRKVQLFSVPDVHVSDLKIATTFDRAFKDATLTAKITIRNQSARASSGTAAIEILALGKSSAVRVSPTTIEWTALAPGETCVKTATISAPSPSKWDNEHPNLYKLIVRANDSEGQSETIAETFGFRQIEVRGNRVFVNGVPIKVRGVCRHEVHPRLGRSLSEPWWQRDAELFREANCNFIRTSHYPPAEEFLDLCDHLGLFVELEAPLCWVGHGASDIFKAVPTSEGIFERLARVNLEAVQGYPNHPSVIVRSLANESTWSRLFARVHTAVRKADPTRPCTFHDQCWDNDNTGSHEMEIAVIHYPGPTGPAMCEKRETRPVHLGEYGHLEAYNRRELATDPGQRDVWGAAFDSMWSKMRTSPGCLGGAIWSGIDDTFFLPSGETVGYGVWGLIDGWRRQKPEFWHVKKAYSPVRLEATCVPAPAANEPLILEIENRQDFTDLGELTFPWKLGERSGTATASAAPGKKGTLAIRLAGEDATGKLLDIRAVSPRGFVIDAWQVAIGVDPRIVAPHPNGVPVKLELQTTDGSFVVRCPRYGVTIDRKTGLMKATDASGKTSVVSGPELMILPAHEDMVVGMQMRGVEPDFGFFSSACRAWKASAVSAKETSDGVEVRIDGEYTEAKGFYTLSFAADGTVALKYSFTATEQGKCDPRQLGVVFDLPTDCTLLSWRRKARLSYYPEDHIGRAQGTAEAFTTPSHLCGLAGPHDEPRWSWSQDGSRYGTNDFRSTKTNIVEASLLSLDGNGLRVLSDGSQHVRTWVDEGRVRMLVANYVNEGGVPFFNEYLVPRQPINAGTNISGTVRFEIR